MAKWKEDNLLLKENANLSEGLGLNGLVEGEDYEVVIDTRDEQLYLVKSYDDAVSIINFDKWELYAKNCYYFVWLRNKKTVSESSKKILIVLNKQTKSIVYTCDSTGTKYTRKLPSYITKAIGREYLLSKFTLNPSTGRYDVTNSRIILDPNTLRYFISDDKDGFDIDFGEISGCFDCSSMGLTSLKGAPTKVEGFFFCQENNLTSLKGAPEEVEGTFYCYKNRLTSLEGAPRYVGEDFDCSYNQLTSLEGSPEYIGWTFDCQNNQLTSLKGAPKKIARSLVCKDNPNLHSLDGIGEVGIKVVKDF